MTNFIRSRTVRSGGPSGTLLPCRQATQTIEANKFRDTEKEDAYE
jgi:hypothetical protein